MATSPTATRLCLQAGIAAPFLYFGAQLIAAPFYPGYSFLSQVASELGSDKAPMPWILNTGIFLTGFATLAAAYGYLKGLLAGDTNRFLAWICAVMLALSSIGTIKAGVYPMPDPRHSSGGFLGVTMLLFPILLLACLWPRRDAKTLKVHLGLSILVILCCIPVVSGRISIDQNSYKGLVQRIFALAVFPPVATGAAYLLRRQKPAI